MRASKVARRLLGGTQSKAMIVAPPTVGSYFGRCPHGKAGNIDHPHCLCAGKLTRSVAVYELKTPEDRHSFPQSVRACMTAATIGASTGPQIRNRTPVANSTSITPGDIGNAVIGAASVGTFNVNDANRGAPCSCWRQRNNWLACIPAFRATADATAPGSIAAATMRSFSALDHLRRCRTEVTISACVFVIGSPPYPLSEPFDNWGELLQKEAKALTSQVFETRHQALSL
jgi:hypothetical protein